MCTKLSVSEYQDEVEKIYKRLSPPDRIKICAVNSNAVPGMYPILGAKPNRMFKEYFSKKNAKKIKDYCDANNQIILPKHVLVMNNGVNFYFGPRYTKFSERYLRKYKLHQVELQNSFVITRLMNVSNSTLNAPSSNYSNLNLESSHETSGSEDIITRRSPQVDRNDNQSSAVMSEHSVDDRFDQYHDSSEQPDDSSEQPNDISEQPVDSSEQTDDSSQQPDDSSQQPDDSSQQPDDSSEHEAETPDTHNQEDDLNSQSSETSTNTEPAYSMKHRNIFLIPEKLNNDKIVSLLHCTKKQFLEFTNKLRPHMKVNEDFLSIYARVFLFRFKVCAHLTLN